MEKTINFWGGFIFGAVIGAAAAAFMAPEPGVQVQARVRERINLMVQEGQRAAAERRAELEAQFAQAKQFQRPSAGPA